MVTKRTARMDAEQRVQNTDGPVAHVDQKPDHPVARLVSSANGGWERLWAGHLEPTKKSAAAEEIVTSVGLKRWARAGQKFCAALPAHDHHRKSTWTSLAMLEKVKAWRPGHGLSCSFEPREKSRAVGLTLKLLAFKFISDDSSFDLFDKECLRLNQVKGIDFSGRGEVRACSAAHAR